MRREGEHSAAEARARWEQDRWALGELDRLARRARHGRFAAELQRRLATLFAAPYKRTATVLSGPELEEARAFAKAQEALAELRAVLGGTPADPAHVLRVMEQLEVHVGDPPQPDRVQVSAPGEIRARRFEAVFCCGLEEGEFPRGASPEPFLSDDDRRAIATASGLVPPVREDRLDRERYLFYVCASRAERLLVLSSRSSDEEGNPQTESYFVDDVRALLAEGAEVRTRSLSEVTWLPEDAPTAAEWDRAHAATGPRRPVPQTVPLSSEPLLDELSRREAVAARALENFADCPVKWLVEDLLKPDELVPDPEALVRGSYAHEVLSRTYERVAEETGRRRVTHENLAAAERILLEELRDKSATFRLSPKQTRVRAAARRLEFDLLRFLRSEADSDSKFEPAELERGFGMGESEPVELDGGLRVRGRIDRVDECDGMALVIDYKTRQARGPLQGRQLGAGEPLPGGALHAGGREAARAAGRRRRVRGARQRRPAPARDGRRGRGRAGRPLGRHRPPLAGGLPREARLGARSHPGDRCAHARRRAARVPRPVRLERRLQVPLGVPERAMSPLTPEQRLAVERRDGSLMVRAGAGTGKTTVLVERFVQAVADDGTDVDQVLAITFTEKAAAEMKSRVRKRFLELDRREDARAAESAWVSTIHGLCARILRAHALSAGIDPAFRVLDEVESERIAADAFDGALEEFMGEDPARIEMVAAYTPDKLRDMVRTAYGHLRSRGERHPRLPETLPPVPAGEADRLEDAARGALAELGMAGGGRASRRRSRRSRSAPRFRAGTRRRSARRPATSTATLTPLTRHRGRRARAPRPHHAALPARAVRRPLRPRQARPLRARLRGPGAGDARPAGGRRRPPRGVFVPRSSTCSWTSSRTRTGCRTSCSRCCRATTCSGSATRTSRSTASATPT